METAAWGRRSNDSFACNTVADLKNCVVGATVHWLKCPIGKTTETLNILNLLYTCSIPSFYQSLVRLARRHCKHIGNIAVADTGCSHWCCVIVPYETDDCLSTLPRFWGASEIKTFVLNGPLCEARRGRRGSGGFLLPPGRQKASVDHRHIDGEQEHDKDVVEQSQDAEDGLRYHVERGDEVHNGGHEAQHDA